MVKPSKGAFNRRTRKLTGKGTVSVAQLVKTFNVDDKVVLTPRAKWAGLPNLRYAGRQGVIVEKRGKSYVVEVDDLAKKKRVIASPIHITLSR